MQIGIVYPHSEIGTDPDDVAEFCLRAEELGYDHVLLYDHVVGIRSSEPEAWNTPELPFTDYIAFFSYVAALTTRLKFATNILVLPQRPAVLVAKQVSVLDRLCRGRFRLGVGVGWNSAEFAALGVPFSQRGKILDEQVEVLRLLWTQESASYEGVYHRFAGAGMSPRPERPIPLWFGGHTERSLRRVASSGDGYMPLPASDDARDASVRRLRELVEESGRDPAQIGLEGRIDHGGRSRPPFAQAAAARSDAEMLDDVVAWTELGATHLHLDGRRTGYHELAPHLEAMERFWRLLADPAAGAAGESFRVARDRSAAG